MSKKAFLAALAVTILILSIGFFVFKNAHQPFDSAKWKQDILARSAMTCPVAEGTSRESVLELLGKPDYPAQLAKDSTFVYRVPSGPNGHTKGILYFEFKQNKVSHVGYDDSGEDVYH